MATGPDPSEPSSEVLLRLAQEWWTTSIIDVRPGSIAIRGYAIEDLIGRVSFSEMVWLMLRAELPTRAQADLLEAALVAAVDHGPSAPSIAASRMAVTCGLPLNGAMASAINMLDDVHGGAGQQCMELYAEIDEAATREGAGPGDVEALARVTSAVVDSWRERGVRYLPGFGHRFHPEDPRAPRLLALVDEAAAKGVVSGRYAAIGRSVTAVLGRGRSAPIPMNVDGVTAVIYSELGFAPELGRGLFVLSRSVGILAHAWEQRQQGGRIKGPMPREIPYRYVGPARRGLEVDQGQRPGSRGGAVSGREIGGGQK
jgi:citrate synthase